MLRWSVLLRKTMCLSTKKEKMSMKKLRTNKMTRIMKNRSRNRKRRNKNKRWRRGSMNRRRLSKSGRSYLEERVVRTSKKRA